MEIITIHPDGVDRLVVTSGRVPKAILTWEAPGLQVYLLRINAKTWGKAANLAMNHAISIHIPPRALRRAGK